MRVKLIFSIIILLLSESSFSLVSQEEWVSQCKEATGEQKKTFDAIRRDMGKYSLISVHEQHRRKATCSQAYERTIKGFKPGYVHSYRKPGELFLHEYDLTDLSPLSGFTHLTNLYLNKNKISDLGPLSNLTSLLALFLDENKISDISPLSNLTKLTTLSLSNNKISDISFLSGLTSLSILKMNKNRISIISSLSELPLLSTLLLNSNRIADLSSLADIPSLTILHVNDNEFSDISPVEHVPELEPKPKKPMQITTRYPEKSEISNEEIYCCICFDQYSKNEELFDIDGCTHLFHKTCLRKWLLKPDNNACPLCKFEIPEKKVGEELENVVEVPEDDDVTDLDITEG